MSSVPDKHPPILEPTEFSSVDSSSPTVVNEEEQQHHDDDKFQEERGGGVRRSRNTKGSGKSEGFIGSNDTCFDSDNAVYCDVNVGHHKSSLEQSIVTEEEITFNHPQEGHDGETESENVETAPPLPHRTTTTKDGNGIAEQAKATTSASSPREEPFSFNVGVSNENDTKSTKNQPTRSKSIQSLTVEQLEDCRRRSLLMRSVAEDDSQKRSSLELRRMPVNVLLKHSLPEESTSDVSEGLDNDLQQSDHDFGGSGSAAAKRKGQKGPDGVRRKEKRRTCGQEYDCLGKFCLRPGFTLRTQMMLSFGSICIMTITVVVAICIALTVLAADNVRDTATVTVEQIAYKYRATRARYVAEALGQRLLLFDIVKLIDEATMDRFDGYPDPSDNGVPFKDMNTQTNIYPLVGHPMPLEWNVTPNVNEDNYNEFVQSRWPFYVSRPVDASNAGFSFQGLCDPNETDPMGDLYWPNCTEANNDIQTGGVTAPSSMTELLHRKGSDLVPLFRALFESREEIRDLGLGFLNNGAGAFINFPHYAVSTHSSFVSIGCDWLLSPNPYDPSRTIGTAEMIGKCHSAGATLSIRLYNPMEREWCRDMALKPETIQANAWEDAWSPGDWILIVGKGVYDRKTREFISCIYMGVSLSRVDEILADSRAVENSESSVIQFNEFGNIISSSKRIPRAPGDSSTAIYDVGLGLTKESYSSLYTLVDYDKEWDPQAVRQAYDKFSPDDGVFFVAAYPMPPIPDEYDPLYRPIFLVVASSLVEAQNAIVDDVNENVDYRVRKINTFAIIVWAIGVVAATLIICAMAHVLTSPLTQMNQVANEIVKNFGDAKKEDEIQKSDDVITAQSRCTPKTELSEVVAEFNVLVANFSGASQARSQKFNDDEVDNRFPGRKIFMQLYSQRNDPSFKYNPAGRSITADPGLDAADGTESVAYMHFGANIATNFSTSINSTAGVASPKEKNSNVAIQKSCSPLFWWIVILIVLPLFFITILVAAGVITTINHEFDRSTVDTEIELIDLQKGALDVYARLRSDFVSTMTEKSIIDLYVLTRYTTWLLFGGLQRANTFTESTTGIEECKTYSPDFSQCEYYEKAFICDCSDMERGYEQVCQNFAESIRPRKLNYWTAEMSAEINGDRLSTDYPVRAFSPQTTDWWANSTTLPGWQNALLAKGYESTYKRLRAISAVPVFQPLYHYGLGEGEEINLGLNAAFEADGLFFGYSGCYSSRHVELVEWKSTEENNAAKLRPELCPLGKHGYDPRCRGWYEEGRSLSSNKGSILHVTAPYRFAGPSRVQFAQTATMAIIDPVTDEHVGQTLLDFLSSPVYHTLQNDTFLYNGGFAVLIAVEGNSLNTVIGPGVSADQASVPIAQSVLRHDAQCKSHNAACMKRYAAFEVIVKNMQGGDAGSESFERATENGFVETMHISYSPVKVISFIPINSSDISRGINRTQHLIYSLALVESEEGLLMPFAQIQDTTRLQSNIAIGVLSIVIFVAICIIVYISHILARSFTEPMLYLLGLIQYINKYVSPLPLSLNFLQIAHSHLTMFLICVSS
jgi:hypothetical protein